MRDEPRNLTFAAKLVVPRDDEAAERLESEIALMRRLHHPHIVGVSAVFQVKKKQVPTAYVQLPYFACGDARAWIDECAPELWKRQRVLLDLARALAHLHSLGYAHGDLKLENVLISEHETAHLADFESVREQPAGGAAASTRTGGISGAGVATQKYKAPELRAAELRSGDDPCAKPTAASDM